MQTFRQMENDETLFSNAQQLKNMLAQAGIALGITAATLGQQWRTTVHYNVLNAQVTPDSPSSRHRPPLAGCVDRQRRSGAGRPDRGGARGADAGQQAALLANIDHFSLIAVLGALGIVVTLLQRVFR